MPRKAHKQKGQLESCPCGCRPRFLLPLLFLVCVRKLLANARGLPRPVAEVVELGATHVAFALDLDRGEQRRIGLESTLDAFAARNLAYDERGVEAAIALRDDHAF